MSRPSHVEAGRPSPAVDVPERPALAPNVRLIGEMQGTGFTDRQWLIQRRSQFIQVTELLYRVAESADGTRTPDEIAARVRETTEWLVSADHIQRILETKLIPMGIIATRDGAVRPDRRRSPLQIQLRRTILGPRVLDSLARTLQVFYAPAVLIPLLLLIALAHGWVYLARGVGEGVRAAFYTPGGLLVVLGIALAAGIFHELGHAAALRYGGGQVRGMGVGLYLVYPTFYTDVSDAYRLGRWARLRTDLGGIYFHLIFALGIIGLYAVFGHEILLAVLLVIGAEIVHQCLPYARLDGYWALADLIGIPDFFSQMGPFSRTFAAHARSKGQELLPRLKPWVRRVFIVYIALTVPVLALLFWLTVRGVPRVMTIGWDSLTYQADVFSVAYGTGDRLLMVAVASQIVLVALSMLAVVYLVYSVSCTLVRALWSWSRPTAARRIAGALTAVGAVSLVAFLWATDQSVASRPVPAGVQVFEITERRHVGTQVSYTVTPPVGGNHAPVWQNCGFYETPVANEHAVHSLEHGAVWITYRPGLARDDVARLRQLAGRQSHVLVTPVPRLEVPVVASAWGNQLRLDSVSDPRLEEFLRAFRLGTQAPERGGPCSGGTGVPNLRR